MEYFPPSIEQIRYWIARVSDRAIAIASQEMRTMDPAPLIEYLDMYYQCGSVNFFDRYMRTNPEAFTPEERDQFNNNVHTVHQVHCEMDRRVTLSEWLCSNSMEVNGEDVFEPQLTGDYTDGTMPYTQVKYADIDAK